MISEWNRVKYEDATGQQSAGVAGTLQGALTLTQSAVVQMRGKKRPAGLADRWILQVSGSSGVGCLRMPQTVRDRRRHTPISSQRRSPQQAGSGPASCVPVV